MHNDWRPPLAERVKSILLTDPTRPDNPITYASAGFEVVTGYPAAEILGRNCRFLQGPDTDPATIALMREATNLGEPGSFEILNYRKDGSTFWNEVSIFPIFDEEGTLAQYVGIQCDVTDRRKRDETYREAQKMEAVGQLAAGVAHDFNSLLTVINGYSDVLLEALPPDAPTREFVHEIRKAGERSAELTRQLLAFSRQQVMLPRSLDLNSLLTEARSALAPLLKDSHSLVVKLESRPWSVLADPSQLEQVLLNLAVNALDAMPDGGTLLLETRNIEGPEGATATRRVLLMVSDTGCGIPGDLQPRLFEPFFTTKEQGKGTGLGLSTVHGIITQTGGEITVHSEVGRGTTFGVLLPAVDAHVSAKAPSVVASVMEARPLIDGPKIVLIAEDEPGLRTLTKRILARSGYEILEASNGEEAIRLLRERTDPVHLLLSDIVMPGADGLQVANVALEEFPQIRVVLMSGYASDHVLHDGTLATDFAFLAKPFSPTDLTRKVAQAFG